MREIKFKLTREELIKILQVKYDVIFKEVKLSHRGFSGIVVAISHLDKLSASWNFLKYSLNELRGKK